MRLMASLAIAARLSLLWASVKMKSTYQTAEPCLSILAEKFTLKQWTRCKISRSWFRLAPGLACIIAIVTRLALIHGWRSVKCRIAAMRCVFESHGVSIEHNANKLSVWTNSLPRQLLPLPVMALQSITSSPSVNDVPPRGFALKPHYFLFVLTLFQSSSKCSQNA